MAHEIETAMYTKQPAWHGLGNVMGDAPTIEDAIRLAGLDWRVALKQIGYFNSGTSVLNECPDHKAVVRESDGRVLGVVGKQYTPLQNSEAFKFFDPILQGGEATIEAAGSLRKGQRIWVLVKLKDAQADIVKNDEVCSYLCLYNGHDGTLRVGIMYTNIRVVCANTLQAAMSGTPDSVKIRHTANLENSLKAVQHAIVLARRSFEFSIEAYRQMAAKKIDVIGLEKYVREVLEVPTAEKKTPKAFDSILTAFESGPGAQTPGVHGTYWGAYNAVTYWVDHARGKKDDNRLDSSWFGVGKQIRQRAFDLAVTVQ